MGYFEQYCQLCGVSFAIARIRGAQEPMTAGWDYTGSGFVEYDSYSEEDSSCGEHTGCTSVKRSDDDDLLEHIAGPGCFSENGYNGCHLSVEEMQGCRAIQCLVQKDSDWESDPTDQDFEIHSNYFLTGVGDGSPDEAPLEDIKPPRHGVNEVLTTNFTDIAEDDEWGLPFHPTCFEIFRKISLSRSGSVDVHGLWEWRKHKCYYDYFMGEFPRDSAVRHCADQWWGHIRGTEYLVANPVNISCLIEYFKKSCCHEEDLDNPMIDWTKFDLPKRRSDCREYQASRDPDPTDLFARLPQELLYVIIDDLSSTDIANLRLVTRVCGELPVTIFRPLVLREMPWFWEARDFPIKHTNWYELYKWMRKLWQHLRPLQNRRRIWKDINNILDDIAELRENGFITEE